MFGDDDMLLVSVTIFWQNILLQTTNNKFSARFDHQLKRFGVDTAHLKERT